MSGPVIPPGAVIRCGYHERGRACREPGVHEVQMDGKRLRLCERHVRPEFHPPDLHKKLPGAVKRVLRNYGGRA